MAQRPDLQRPGQHPGQPRKHPGRGSAGARRARGVPVWERGRAGRFWGGFVDYARTAWWGLARPRLSEERALEISQAVILRGEGQDAQVLLSIRSDLFGWELPGGTIEIGEVPEAALRREVREETGLEVEIEAHVGDWIREGFRPHIAHVYRCRVVAGSLAPSHETPRLAWFAATSPPSALFGWYRAPLAAAIEAAPAEDHHEFQGLASILGAMRIDVALRWSGLPDSELAAEASSPRDRR